MHRVFACIRGLGDKVLCAWAIPVPPFTEICPGIVLRGDVPTSGDGTEWWSVTADTALSDEYEGVAPKYAERGVLSL